MRLIRRRQLSFAGVSVDWVWSITIIQYAAELVTPASRCAVDPQPAFESRTFMR